MNTATSRGGAARWRRVPKWPVGVLAVAGALVSTVALARGGRRGETIPLDEARVFLEENATDGDLGIHIFWDGEAWTKMAVRDPRGRTIFKTSNKGSLKEIGSTEVFTESEEPEFAEMPRAEFLALFPEGPYTFAGKGDEGDKLTGTAVLSHVMPGGPVIVSPVADEEVDRASVVVRWQTVPDPPGAGNAITGYEVVVEQEDPLRVFSIHMPATATSVTVPPEFLAPDKETKVEILAISANGNRTATEVPFRVR